MKKYVPIFFVFLIGAFLRFNALGVVPVALHRDEAFLGYNAYSLLKTGRDISGAVLPLNLKSFLYSPAGYAYFSIPFIKVFGLSAFSVRFASALFGSLTIPLLYLFVSTLTQVCTNETKILRQSKTVALFSSLFLALSPWHINLSRTATENTVVTFFVVLGALLLFQHLRHRKTSYLIFSLLSFFITLFLYQASRAFVPIVIPFLTLLFWSKLTKSHKILLMILYGVFIVLPVALVLKSPELSTRIRSLSIFEFPQTKIMVNDWITSDGVTHMPYVATRMFHNKITGYLLTFTENLADHFSYGFLFSDKGLPDRYRIPSVGLLYPFELIFLFIALVHLFSTRQRTGIVLIGWIVIAFVGSALTFDDVPNLQRTLMAAPAFCALSGYGAAQLYDIIRKKKMAKIGLTVIAVIMAYCVGFYILQYYSYGKLYRPWYRQDGYKQLVAEVNADLRHYPKAIITSREGAPTIFFLFYSQYDPWRFQQETKNVDTFASDHVSFANYIFTTDECPLRIDDVTKQLTGLPGTLYVNSTLCGQAPKGVTLLDELHRIDGSGVFEILAPSK